MRRFVLLLLLCVSMCCLCCGCTSLQTMLKEQLDTPSTVVIVTGMSANEFNAFNAAAVPPQNDSGLNFTCIAAANYSDQYEALQAAAAAQDTAVLIAELGTKGMAQHIIQLAKRHDVPLILYGTRPEQAVMDSYDMCWYVGFDPVLAADLQAELFVQAYHLEQIQDQTDDFKFSLLWLNTLNGQTHQIENFPNIIVQNLKLGGISVDEPIHQMYEADGEALYQSMQAFLLPQTDTADDVSSESAVLLAPEVQTELFACGDVSSSEIALQLINDLNVAASNEALANYATPARKYAAVCFGHSEIIENGLQDGTVLGTVAYDTEAATSAILTLAANLASGQSPVKNTDYHFENGKYLMLDYLVLQGITGE